MFLEDSLEGRMSRRQRTGGQVRRLLTRKFLLFSIRRRRILASHQRVTGTYVRLEKKKSSCRGRPQTSEGRECEMVPRSVVKKVRRTPGTGETTRCVYGVEDRLPWAGRQKTRLPGAIHFGRVYQGRGGNRMVKLVCFCADYLLNLTKALFLFQM